MFTILTIGDPHFKHDNGESTEELTVKLLELIKSRIDDLDAVAILGDILHNHEKVDIPSHCRAMDCIMSIHDLLCVENKKRKRDVRNHSNVPIPLYIIIGNHDRVNNRVFMTDEHIFRPLKKWKNTIVVDKAMLHSPKPGFEILLMPYVAPGRFQEAYESVISERDLNTKVNLVLAHQEFQGAKMNKITSNEGDHWDSLKPLCVSGHVHDYQVLKSNLIYTGTPIQHGFSDMGKKTVSIYKISYIKPLRDSEDDIPGPTPLEIANLTYKEERINLGIRGRTIVEGNVKNFDSLYLPIDDFFVKVKLQGTKREIKTFRESKKHDEAVKKGIVFQFLELPTVDLSEGGKILEPIYKQKDINSGKSFSERLKETLVTLEENIRNEYMKIFSK